MTARVALGRGADVGLPADPGQQRLGHGAVAAGDGPSIGAERRREGRRVTGNRGETPLHEIGGLCQEGSRGALRDASFGENVFLQRVEPVVENRAEGALVGVCGREAFSEPAVHCLEAVQRRLRFGDLDLGRGEAFAFRPLLQPAHEEGLPATVLAANRLELCATGAHGCQFFAHRGVERIEADREGVEIALRNGSAP